MSRTKFQNEIRITKKTFTSDLHDVGVSPAHSGSNGLDLEFEGNDLNYI